MSIWLILYEGQTESSYEWTARNYGQALNLMKSLETEFPDRKWDMIEKDVS